MTDCVPVSEGRVRLSVTYLRFDRVENFTYLGSLVPCGKDVTEEIGAHRTYYALVNRIKCNPSLIP